MVKFVIDGSGTHPDRYLLGRATYFRPENIITSVGDLDVWVPSGYPLQSSLTSSSPDTSSLTSTASARRNSRGGAVKVPRPPNAYILYRKDNHKAVKQENPSLSNNDICKLYNSFMSLSFSYRANLIAVILGRRWNNETDIVRVHYHKMAVEIKRQVEILHPHYKYNPRKPSEIRRRARSGNHGVYTVEGGQASESFDTMPTPPLDFETASNDSLMSPTSDIWFALGMLS